MLSKIISKWKIMNVSQKIVAIILLILIAIYIFTPIYNQIKLREQTKQEFVELCNLAASGTNNQSACGCAWDKAVSKYGYDNLQKQLKYNGYVNPADLVDWVLQCKA